MLNSRLADPRLSDVCITDAEVSPDLRLATIYFRIYPTATIADDVAHAALEHARPVFRRELGQQLRLRSVPDLRFRLDTTADHAAHIDQLLSEIQAERRAEEMEDSTGDDAGDDDASLEEE